MTFTIGLGAFKWISFFGGFLVGVAFIVGLLAIIAVSGAFNR